MNYELAKELKEAGFPEPRHCDCNFSQLQGGYYTPSLEELIEACGDKFSSLSKVATYWVADDTGHSFGPNDGMVQSSASEAVARLWLSLNGKPHAH